MNFIKKMCFLHLFHSEYITIVFFLKKTPTIQIGGDFIDGHYIIFSIFFCLVMFHES
jgi:hypothetical protein